MAVATRFTVTYRSKDAFNLPAPVRIHGNADGTSTDTLGDILTAVAALGTPLDAAMDSKNIEAVIEIVTTSIGTVKGSPVAGSRQTEGATLEYVSTAPDSDTIVIPAFKVAGYNSDGETVNGAATDVAALTAKLLSSGTAAITWTDEDGNVLTSFFAGQHGVHTKRSARRARHRVG